MNCPLDLVSIPALVSAGALIGRRIGIRPQQRTSWLEVGNLWGCVVARPGSLKSPAASEALAPIKRIEALAAEANREAQAAFKVGEALYKLEKEEADKAARRRLSGEGKESARAMLESVTAPEPPTERRHLTSDATAEKLGEICKANPFGIMMHRDELISLFDDLDGSEKASAKGFFLSAWSGTEGYTFDRIGRGTVHIPAVNLSVFGTTQPARLASYMRENLRRHDDGMVQRLQLIAWPDSTGQYQEVDRYPDSDARRLAHECYQGLAALDPRELKADWDEFDGPHGVPFLRFAGDAQELFSEWRAVLEARLAGDELSAPLASHLSKYRGLVPRLSLVCHLANNSFGPVSLEAVRQALRWAEYLESHAVRAYASTSLDNAEAARAIWRHVRKGDLGDPFTLRDVQRKGWSGLQANERIAAGLEALSDADWLRPAPTEAGEKGGRPSTPYQINPKALRA
ncbi:YfjI family protein [Novosphingobium ginsenosidimutans]|nr:YfjI family protein [Novosphingobium ginsenosidimutans]